MIAAITPFTLLDYPAKLSAILWFAGCNLRCLYCYNYELLSTKDFVSTENILTFLQSRIGLLNGVVCSGGECSVWGEKSIRLIREIKQLGFAIKIDHNGTNPEFIEKLLTQKLIDFVALDFKAPRDKMKEICGKDFFYTFQDCFYLLQKSNIDFEIRTTFHSDLLTKEDIQSMHKWLKDRGYKKEFFIQGFVGDKGSLGNLNKSQNHLIKNCRNIVYRGK